MRAGRICGAVLAAFSEARGRQSGNHSPRKTRTTRKRGFISRRIFSVPSVLSVVGKSPWRRVSPVVCQRIGRRRFANGDLPSNVEFGLCSACGPQRNGSSQESFAKKSRWSCPRGAAKVEDRVEGPIAHKLTLTMARVVTLCADVPRVARLSRAAGPVCTSESVCLAANAEPRCAPHGRQSG